MDIELNEHENNLVNYLSRKGWKIYAVGGSVRDTLMGKPRGDLDIVVEAPRFKDLIHHLKERYNVLRDGIPYKEAKVVIGPKQIIDVTVPRGEIYPGPAKEPVEFEVGNIFKDLSRRDFTINAMALELNGSQRILMDPFKGSRDIAEGIVRFVGDPDRRIDEDPLRMLRAIRFSSTLGFRIDTDSFKSVCEKVQLLSYVSKERVRDEMFKAAPAFGKFLEGIISIGASNIVFGIDPVEWEGVKHDSRGHHYGESLLQHTKDVLENIENEEQASGRRVPFEVKLAAIYHDSGKVASMNIIGNKITFHDHPKFSKEFASPIIRGFHFSKERENHVIFLIAGHMRFAEANRQRPSTVPRYVVDARLRHIPLQWMTDLVTLSKADGHPALSAELIRKLYEVERPRGNWLMQIPPERRKDAVRSEWIKVATNSVDSEIAAVKVENNVYNL